MRGRKRNAISAGIGILSSSIVVMVFAQGVSTTHVVKVNTDGSFTPRVLSIKSGDTVRWEGLGRTDSIIPASNDPYPAMCTRRSAYDPTKTNEFTGPMNFAPGGTYVLSPLEEGMLEREGSCPGNAAPMARGDNGKVLCRGGQYEATMEATWRSDQIAGVFIRLLWSDIEPQSGVYDFNILQREIEQAVKSGKVYSLGIKAGNDGTPDWIFSTNQNGSQRANGGGGVPRLRLQDFGSDGTPTSCGVQMDLGNPTRATYQQLYSRMLTEVAKFVKSRADWYRALAYIKLSGANLYSHENRLPDMCLALGSGAAQTRCTCNTSVFSSDGYRPSLLYKFYDDQEKLLASLYPGKPMSYALIQDGFPRVNETGGYFDYDGSSSDKLPLPGNTEQTEALLDNGQRAFGRSFVVQHNGVGSGGGSAICNFSGQHPFPVRPLNGYSDPGCPNKWAVREGAEGQLTGFQTRNPSDVATPLALDATFQNVWDNSDGMFLEIYENLFWISVNTNRGVLSARGKTIGNWNEDLIRRRVDPAFPNFTAAGNPFPATHSFTFRNTNADRAPLALTYVHGMKCGQGNQEWGQIVVDAQPPSILSGGVVSAGSFGASTSVALGTWIEIYGSNLAATTRGWSGSDFNGANAPTVLEGTSVRIGGQTAYVAYVSPGQVNVQVPSNVSQGAQTLSVTSPFGASANYTVNVNAVQPGLLAPPSFQIGGRQYVGALFPDNVTFALPPGAIAGVNSRRAAPGDVLTIYGIGFGPVTPSVPAGQLAQGTTSLALPFQINFGQTRATLNYAGLAPGLVGIYQFNVVVPNVPANDAVPLTYSLNGVTGAQSLFVAVR